MRHLAATSRPTSRTLVLLLLILGGMGLAACSEEVAAPNHPIFFRRGWGEEGHWYEYSFDGRIPKRLDVPITTDLTPSPDGKHIAAVDHELLFIEDVATGERQTLVEGNGHHLYSVSWSPDGNLIAYREEIPVENEPDIVHVVPTDGGSPREIGRGQFWDTMAWAPDSSAVAAAGLDDGVWVLPIDGKPRQVHEGFAHEPAWSAKGIIAFEVGQGELRVVRADGTGNRVFRRGGSHPAWSPDGSELAFTIEEGGAFGIAVASPSGEVKHRILPENASLNSPEWSPDGNWLVYMSLDTTDDAISKSHLVISRPSGSKAKPLTQGPTDLRPTW